MSDRPGTILPEVPATLHPRRPPAHKSVSLRHSPPAVNMPPKAPTFYHPQQTSVSSPNLASDKANPPTHSSTSPRNSLNKHSSGESSDAGKWFEVTNNAVQGNNPLDNEPPFFLRNSSSSETPPDGYVYDHNQQTSMPYRPGGLGVHTESVEDFRSVIDDLTIANKKLKQRLRKYEKLHDAHLQDEKLFEVRFHGLPDHKKRELEETLRKFAADLDDTPSAEHLNNLAHPPQLDPHKTASSHASRVAESGYASMSGQNSSSAPSNHPSTHVLSSTTDRDRRRMTKSQYQTHYNQQQQSIRSYLHDIPRGLLPKSSVRMTEKSKKKMVVRRLEQIFAGKRSVPGTHPQPMQQEEVAQSAAQDDRRAMEATGRSSKKEGNREARIMPVQADDEDITGHYPAELLPRRSQLLEQEVTGFASPDQRPTRPLDLDPFRAQVPLENMDYIRHLGFTPPDQLERSPEEGHGWIYLNLLINMAQLHTLNVTPDFVKEAVTDYSSKFELSHDGRKIRWRGGQPATLSSTGSSSEYQGDSPDASKSLSPSKQVNSGTSGSKSSSINVDPEREARRIARAQRKKEKNMLSYTPLFFHEDASDEDMDSYGRGMGSSSNSMFQVQPGGDSSGFGSSAMHSSSSKRRRNDGPMIFYSKAKFCTDLTGDSRGIASHPIDSYQNITDHPIGLKSFHRNDSSKQSPGPGESRDLFDNSFMMDIDLHAPASSSGEEFHFSPGTLKDDNGTDSSDLMDFEASGLGGVLPEDNFSIRVLRSQTSTRPVDATALKRRKQLYPKKILDVLNERESDKVEASSTQRPVIREQILSASRKTMPNSTLPPASFLPFDSTSSADMDSDLESNVSSSPMSSSSSDNDGPSTALQLRNISPVDHTYGSGGSSDDDNESDDDDDGSIDLLATARQMDPQTIIASEREYDAAIAERLANEIPAGSSAATAAGGSGFNSPASPLGLAASADADRSSQKSRAQHLSLEGESLSPRGQLKRNRTRESVTSTLQGSKNQKSQKTE